MTESSSVILEKRGQAFWITINRPDKRNALNGDVIAGIARGYRDAHDDSEVRVIVLTGRATRPFAPEPTCRTAALPSRWTIPSRMSITLICYDSRKTRPNPRSRA